MFLPASDLSEGSSIGLHVEGDATGRMSPNEPSVQTVRRRVWYCLYILDQLVALQLSRPPAIRQGDFNVSLPARSDDVPSSDQTGTTTEKDPWIGDYFVSMIQFSHIIGQVLRNLYSPMGALLNEATLSTIERFDQTLLEWKLNLPRSLRFDLGHTFEKSVTFRRQRNMLAIKFYSLRALIHRPYLSRSTGDINLDPKSFPASDLEHWRISQSKRACVDAAQQTARLLHNIEDKKGLIFGFPWWQMISCLICASSILLVARILLDHDQQTDGEGFDWAAVEEDADLCLRVFEVLSTNSKAARLARDMMEGLKETRSRVNLCPKGQQTVASFQETSDTVSRSDFSLLGFYGIESEDSSSEYRGLGQGISEPVMWSAQFVDAAYNPFLGYSSTTL
ncbi:hypothetical protein LTR70_010231 [Exophiala xenobiotica]|uniref:Xylanolytic transcriptional activator regulatory domain-containing protein n=1 Tax=Lithohypha guttulata TaxID=1690604 RepID=A0ABR0JUI9_9EURO|nr:hypothetical protein LTR24_010239 [Lithohypha guttulata]KAK5309499.1 hypothetical protein LTR70_010231 [Exophiala xenobiotica]